jgi:hypothetical protein
MQLCFTLELHNKKEEEYGKSLHIFNKHKVVIRKLRFYET